MQMTYASSFKTEYRQAVIGSFAVYGFCGWWISWLCASSRQSSSSDYQVSMQGFLCLRCNIPVEK